MSTEERNAYFHYLKESSPSPRYNYCCSARGKANRQRKEKGKIEGEKIGRKKEKLVG